MNYPLIPVNVAVDQGERNEGGKNSSDSASASTSSQTQRRRVRGGPSVRHDRSSALSPGNLEEEKDNDDDPVNSGKSSKPLSQCVASSTLVDQSNCPDVRKSKIAYENSIMESDTGKEVDESHDNQTIGFTSCIWAAAKSFLVKGGGVHP